MTRTIINININYSYIYIYSSFIRPNRQHDKEHTKRMMKVGDNSAFNMNRKSVTLGFLLCNYTVNRIK